MNEGKLNTLNIRVGKTKWKLDFFGKLPVQLLEMSVLTNFTNFISDSSTGFLLCNRLSLRKL